MITLSTGQVIEITDEWVHEACTIFQCRACYHTAELTCLCGKVHELGRQLHEFKLPPGAEPICPKCGGSDLITHATLVHVVHVVALWASQADKDAGKPPLQINDFETQFSHPLPHPSEPDLTPGEYMRARVFEPRARNLLPDIRTLAKPAAQPHDIHGILSHPSMEPFKPSKS